LGRRQTHDAELDVLQQALRDMHQKDAFYQGHAKTQQSLAHVPEEDALAQLAQTQQSNAGSQPGVPATPRLSVHAASVQVQYPYSQMHSSPKAEASQSGCQSARESRKVSTTSAAEQKAMTPRILSSRLQTSDIVDLAHAQIAMNKNQAMNRRDKARMGAYAGQANPQTEQRIWMSPRTHPAGKPPPHAGHDVPGKISKMNPKDLVEKMTKKEMELKQRLEGARKAQIVADVELDKGFKEFHAMQVSARKAIREGSY